jgi:hypothetical protein
MFYRAPHAKKLPWVPRSAAAARQAMHYPDLSCTRIPKLPYVETPSPRFLFNEGLPCRVRVRCSGFFRRFYSYQFMLNLVLPSKLNLPLF